MKLNIENLESIKSLCDKVPEYDVLEVRENTIKNPTWLHFGAGNIFRGYIARLDQDMLNKGLVDTGINVAESFDYEIIDKIYKPYDNLTLSITLNKDGDFENNLIANLSEALKINSDFNRLVEIVKNKSLQIISFTITEKGYNIYKPNGEFLDIVKEDIEKGIESPKHIMSLVARLLYERFKENSLPIAVLSLDNCSHNGEKLSSSIIEIVEKWVENGFVEKEFLDYLNNEEKVSFPWSMIDKITPRPAEVIEKYLNEKGFEDISSVVTEKHTYIAPFVNSEEAEYLVIEDKFPNGRAPLEEAGVYMTSRETVNKVEKMKVTTCLNPLHTTLAVYGCMLSYESISDEMKDKELVGLIKEIGYNEALKVVVDPLILNPKDFIDEVIEVRLPNPYIPDTPQRIATDTSQKIPIRFGETIKSYYNSEDKKVSDLKFIPLALAGWLRYLLGVDDNLEEFERSSDPLLEELTNTLKDIKVGDFKETEELKNLLRNEMIFGVNLEEVGLSDLVIQYFKELSAGKGSIRKTLEKYVR